MIFKAQGGIALRHYLPRMLPARAVNGVGSWWHVNGQLNLVIVPNKCSVSNAIRKRYQRETATIQRACRVVYLSNNGSDRTVDVDVEIYNATAQFRRNV